jgi:Superinfection immunity protein
VTTERRPGVGWLIAGLLMLGVVIWLGTLPKVPAAFIGGALLLYFLPTFVAWNREHPSAFAIFLLNFLGGWTFIGWLIALIWSCVAIRRD